MKQVVFTPPFASEAKISQAAKSARIFDWRSVSELPSFTPDEIAVAEQSGGVNFISYPLAGRVLAPVNEGSGSNRRQARNPDGSYVYKLENGAVPVTVALSAADLQAIQEVAIELTVNQAVAPMVQAMNKQGTSLYTPQVITSDIITAFWKADSASVYAQLALKHRPQSATSVHAIAAMCEADASEESLAAVSEAAAQMMNRAKAQIGKNSSLTSAQKTAQVAVIDAILAIHKARKKPAKLKADSERVQSYSRFVGALANRYVAAHKQASEMLEAMLNDPTTPPEKLESTNNSLAIVNNFTAAATDILCVLDNVANELKAAEVAKAQKAKAAEAAALAAVEDADGDDDGVAEADDSLAALGL